MLMRTEHGCDAFRFRPVIPGFVFPAGPWRTWSVGPAAVPPSSECVPAVDNDATIATMGYWMAEVKYSLRFDVAEAPCESRLYLCT